MKLVFKPAAIAVAAFALSATTVFAVQDPIGMRKASMEEVGKHAKVGAAMAKGEAPFDLAKAKELFATVERVAKVMPDLFPDDSKTGKAKNGKETEASPKIWQNTADFKAKFVKLGADAKAAQASVKDLDTFKMALGGIGKQCGGCHQEYRLKKN
jgi:cytochrome c556